MKRASIIGLVASLATTFALTTACESPDAGARFDEYTSIVGDEAPPSELCDAEVRDMSGKYFFRLQHQLSPVHNILMELDIVSTAENTYTLTFMPLKADLVTGGDPEDPEDWRDDAREPVGTPIVVEGVQQSPNGEFDLELIQASVTGEANSLTGGEILADIFMTVAACSDGLICGDGKLDLFAPLALKNQRGTFGATLANDGIDDSNTAPFSCSSDPR